MDIQQLHSDELWPYLLAYLPSNYAELAVEHQALRRCRHVPDAGALLRMMLTYAVTDLSLKDVAAWATAGHIADVSGPALFYRVRDAEAWLAALLAAVLAREVTPLPGLSVRARVVDATVLTGPGATGTDWRVHLLIDPGSGRFCAAEVTDAAGGESFARHPLTAGEVVLGDRGYAHARGIASAVNRGAQVVARVNPYAIRLCRPDRTVLPVAAWQAQVPRVGGVEWDILIPVPPDTTATRSHHSWPLAKAAQWMPARLCAARTRTQEVIGVLTTLPRTQATTTQCLALYRVRWQVELVFKRLKSLLDFDALPSRHGPTARSWVLARLLAAAIAQHLVRPSGAFPPWGYPLDGAAQRLVSVSHDALGGAHDRARAVGAGVHPHGGKSAAPRGVTAEAVTAAGARLVSK